MFLLSGTLLPATLADPEATAGPEATSADPEASTTGKGPDAKCICFTPNVSDRVE